MSQKVRLSSSIGTLGEGSPGTDTVDPRPAGSVGAQGYRVCVSPQDLLTGQVGGRTQWWLWRAFHRGGCLRTAARHVGGGSGDTTPV